MTTAKNQPVLPCNLYDEREFVSCKFYFLTSRFVVSIYQWSFVRRLLLSSFSEYGFSRPINSQQCAKDDNIIALDACIKGELKKIVSKGYRLLPGDKCDPTNGFKPDATKQVALNKHCGKDEQGTDFKGVVKESKPIAAQKKTAAPVKKSTDKSKFIWIACGVCLALIACVLLAVMLTRYWQIRKRDVSLKFSLLTDAHENDFSASMDADLLDAGVQKSTQNGARANGVEGKTNAILRSYHDDSDVDILE